MPRVDFNPSDRGWHKATLARAQEFVREAEAQAMAQANGMIGETLVEICKAHGQPPAKDGALVYDSKGAVLALLWGDEMVAWQKGELTIPGAVVPVVKAQAAGVLTKLKNKKK